MITNAPKRGFALLISILLTSVSLAIGLALLDTAYKELILATTTKQSGIAFYAADSVMECVLYYDQKFDTFAYGATTPSNGAVRCNSVDVPNASYVWNNSSNPRIRSFPIACTGGGTLGNVTIYKYPDGRTNIYTSGYNTCSATDVRRIERGLKAIF